MRYERMERPSKKSDWIGKQLRLERRVPPQWWKGEEPMPPFRPGYGDVVRIARRLNASETAHSSSDVSRWGNVRVLKIEYMCEHCQALHFYYIPEDWIFQRHVEFVEACDD